MNTIKLDNIEKIAQGRLSGFSANYVNDTRMSAKWLIELVQEVRRLNYQRLVFRARASRIHKLLAKVDPEGESAALATEIKQILGSGGE